MSINISYKNSLSKANTINLIFFVDEKFNILHLKKYISSSEYSFILDLIKTKDTKKKILTFDINSKRKIILVSLKKNSTNSDAENLGANFLDLLINFKRNEYNFNTDSVSNNLKNLVGHFLHGLKLKSYKFEKYKTKKNKKIILINIILFGRVSIKII